MGWLGGLGSVELGRAPVALYTRTPHTRSNHHTSEVQMIGPTKNHPLTNHYCFQYRCFFPCFSLLSSSEVLSRISVCLYFFSVFFLCIISGFQLRGFFFSGNKSCLVFCRYYLCCFCFCLLFSSRKL
ncbi:hypothetical protein BZA77DRAFT_309346 [Pyronema omphalodes]|nr:hypothetical protein BZA77DRAFT_309346 [Pyronema omphalodes]